MGRCWRGAKQPRGVREQGEVAHGLGAEDEQIDEGQDGYGHASRVIRPTVRSHARRVGGLVRECAGRDAHNQADLGAGHHKGQEFSVSLSLDVHAVSADEDGRKSCPYSGESLHGVDLILGRHSQYTDL